MDRPHFHAGARMSNYDIMIVVLILATLVIGARVLWMRF